MMPLRLHAPAAVAVYTRVRKYVVMPLPWPVVVRGATVDPKPNGPTPDFHCPSSNTAADQELGTASATSQYRHDCVAENTGMMI